MRIRYNLWKIAIRFVLFVMDRLLPWPAALVAINLPNAILRYSLLFLFTFTLTAPALWDIGIYPHILTGLNLDLSQIEIPIILTEPWLILTGLTAQLLLIISVTRAWAANESKRALYYRDGQSDDIERDFDILTFPDLRDEMFVASVLLIAILPIFLLYLNGITCSTADLDACLFQGGDRLSQWYSFEAQAMMRAGVLFDLPEVYGWTYWSSVPVANNPGEHVEMAVRVIFDVIIVAAIFDLVKIFNLNRDALGKLTRETTLNDHEVDQISRLGPRIVSMIINVLENNAKSSSPDREESDDEVLATEATRNLASVLGSIRHPRALRQLQPLLTNRSLKVRGDSAMAIALIIEAIGNDQQNQLRRPNRAQVENIRRFLDEAREKVLHNRYPLRRIDRALAAIGNLA